LLVHGFEEREQLGLDAEATREAGLRRLASDDVDPVWSKRATEVIARKREEALVLT
jgi:hypothetical protein